MMVFPRLLLAAQIALVRLYMDGPDTNGILRRSASARQVRELREDIDRGTCDVTLSQVDTMVD